MSANIYWEPLKTTRDRDLDVAAPSSFISAMRKAFGDGNEWTFDESSVSTLEGMAAAYGYPNPYYELLSLLAKHDRIRIWAEY